MRASFLNVEPGLTRLLVECLGTCASTFIGMQPDPNVCLWDLFPLRCFGVAYVSLKFECRLVLLIIKTTYSSYAQATALVVNLSALMNCCVDWNCWTSYLWRSRPWNSGYRQLALSLFVMDLASSLDVALTSKSGLLCIMAALATYEGFCPDSMVAEVRLQ